MVWKRDDDGMWIALIRFNRQVEARLEPVASRLAVEGRAAERSSIGAATPIIRLSCLTYLFIPFERCAAVRRRRWGC